MAQQFDSALRDALLDQWEANIGTAPILRWYTGSMPANTAAAATGTLIGEVVLPSDWMAAASGGTKAKLGTWSEPAANNAGSFGYFRLYNNADTVCKHQGTAGTAGTDMIMSAASVVAGQPITVTTFTQTAPNA